MNELNSKVPVPVLLQPFHLPLIDVLYTININYTSFVFYILFFCIIRNPDGRPFILIPHLILVRMRIRIWYNINKYVLKLPTAKEF